MSGVFVLMCGFRECDRTSVAPLEEVVVFDRGNGLWDRSPEMALV